MSMHEVKVRIEWTTKLGRPQLYENASQPRSSNCPATEHRNRLMPPRSLAGGRASSRARPRVTTDEKTDETR
jgi:hypothetical protein